MRILHVVASGQRRGAEIFTSELIGALNHFGPSQRVAVLHGAEPIAVRYQAPTAVLGSTDHAPVDPRILMALRRIVGSWRPEVVQAHGGEALKYCVPATAGRRTLVVYRRWGSSAAQGTRRLVYGWLMRRADRVVAVADVIRRETVELFGVAPRRIVTIPNARDAERLRPTKGRDEMRRSLGVLPEATVVLSVGALTWEKDPLAQVELVDRILREEAGTVHLMAGDGPLRPKVEAAIGRRGLGGRVLLLGVRDDVPELLAASDVLVLTSRSEGLPGIAIEAGMVGLPVAAYAVGGVPEVVLDGTTGFLAPPGDLETLSKGILRFLRDSEARNAMGRAARDRCLSQFEIGAIAPRYFELYEGLLISRTAE